MRESGIKATQPQKPTMLTLETSPLNEVKLQVPPAGGGRDAGQLWPAVSGTDFGGGCASSSHTLGTEAQASAQRPGAAARVRSPPQLAYRVPAAPV